MKPIALTPNQPAQFYRGGRVIGRFRGVTPADAHRPEDHGGRRRHGARDGKRDGDPLRRRRDDAERVLVAMRCRPASVEAALAGGLGASAHNNTGEGSGNE
jgi:hypothetical protein